jgi:hypothetical protein
MSLFPGGRARSGKQRRYDIARRFSNRVRLQSTGKLPAIEPKSQLTDSVCSDFGLRAGPVVIVGESMRAFSSSTRYSPSSRTLWETLRDLVMEWIGLYKKDGEVYSKIKDGLLAAKLVDQDGSSLKVSTISLQRWFETMHISEPDYDVALKEAIEQLEMGLNHLRRQTASTSSSAPVVDPFLIEAKVNGVSVNLHFKNSGNNEISDIEVYLQEKLDVLEFIQMDCNKMEMTQLPPTRLPISTKENTSQLDQSSLSVADWYTNQTSTSIHISQGESFIESVHVPLQRSQLQELAEDGFFIGTPTSREQILLDQSNLDWETSSIISSASHRRKGRNKPESSRNRSLSSCSVSSVEDSRVSKQPASGMFERGRMARIAANISGFYDENEAGGTGNANPWWDTNY